MTTTLCTVTLNGRSMSFRACHDQNGTMLTEQLASKLDIAAIVLVQDWDGRVKDTITHAQAREMIRKASTNPAATIQGSV